MAIRLCCAFPIEQISFPSCICKDGRCNACADFEHIVLSTTRSSSLGSVDSFSSLFRSLTTHSPSSRFDSGRELSSENVAISSCIFYSPTLNQSAHLHIYSSSAPSACTNQILHAVPWPSFNLENNNSPVIFPEPYLGVFGP